MTPILQAGTRSNRTLRILLVAVAAAAALVGLHGGLTRLGWATSLGADLAALHGPLMISGLLGTVIGLERAVALDRGWAYLAPIFAGLASLALVADLTREIGAGMYVVSSMFLCGASFVVTRQQPMLFNGTLLLGSLAWLVGNLLWFSGHSIPEIMGWWLAFLILTIAGERLELSRVMAPKRGSQGIFLLSVALLLAGAQNALQTESGSRLFGLAMLGMTAWLLRFDIAGRNIRQTGQTRYFAACMLSGYIWLAVGGLILVALPAHAAAFRYDMALHAVLIGFVVSMVFGHALIILPAVIRVRLRYRPVMYLPLILLHAALAARMLGGFYELASLRAWSGIAVLLAFLAFAACMRHGAGCARVPAAPSTAAGTGASQ